MNPSQAFETHRPQIREIVARHGATNPRIFGSVVRGTATEASDIDLLVDPLKKFSLFSQAALQRELQELLGCHVDVVFPKELSDHIFFKVIVEARPV